MGAARPAVAAWAVAAVLLQVAGLALFLYGFFPVKPTLRGFSGAESYRMPSCGPVSGGEDQSALPPDQLRSLYRELSGIPPVYDRLVLMVIDGLPAEFVLGRDGKPPSKEMMESMPYTQSLLAGCKAAGYHAKAAPPTVTMPRLKAMVSGAIGGFLDVAFNFNTQAFLEDNLLDQLHMIGCKLVMLGDETWIKLFPTLFDRQDGVSSFYVKDTVEVDYNVSRHLEIELAAKDWSALVLHYLGLDHVGHIGGRRSVLMTQKMKEMDDVIRMVHAASLQDNPDRTLLVVVSDHGMTEGGSHGGSSYQETDSLALFIGYSVESSFCSPYNQNEALQVDLAPTLALLFGVPIPKNNIGVVLLKLFNSLTDEQKLRTLELNSWQISRLLQAHIPDFCLEDCINSEGSSGIEANPESIEKKLCHLLSKVVSHQSSSLHHSSSFKSTDAGYFGTAVDAYYGFLRYMSEWLSHRATDKPFNLLICAISLMMMSCLCLMGIVFHLSKGQPVSQVENQSDSHLDQHWHLDEAFILVGIFLYVISFASSSFVEEEQYTWHFLTSTLYLIFLIKTVRSMLKESISQVQIAKGEIVDGNNFSYATNHKLSPGKRDGCKLCTVLIVLVAGRIIRAWHQGGVNWVHFPDISKLLTQADSSVVKSLQIISVLAVVASYSVSLMLLRASAKYVIGVWLSHISCGVLVLLHIWESQINTSLPVNHSATLIAQIFYAIASVSIIVTVLASPWMFPLYSTQAEPAASSGSNLERAIHLRGINNSVFLTGVTYTMFWCLLQLLLQQPTNAIPLFLIFLQIILSIVHFSLDKTLHKQWVQVVAMQFLGMAGHFGLGNTNSLASIDVAGAFIGISSYSTVLSGILMFSITYASPLLLYLGMVVYVSVKDSYDISTAQQPKCSYILGKMITWPCLLPLLINSVALTSYTIVLLLMRNHLFVWSVFSPKYLYVCAATVCTYVGVLIIAMTAVYNCTVYSFRVRSCSRKAL
ncbi:hypothetical protein ACP4OV_000397 [Aristida adscensionis]